MRTLLVILTIVLTSNLCACPSTHNEFPDGMNIDRVAKITAPIYLSLNTTLSFPVFEDEMTIFTDPDYANVQLILKSKNGPQDHEQLFIPHKLRLVTELSYNEISTENLIIEFSDYEGKNYGQFKLDSQNMISFCYEAKSPIEYR